MKLIKFRNDYPEFDGQFALLESESHILKFNWKNNIYECTLTVNLKNYETVLIYSKDGETFEKDFKVYK